MPRPLYPSVGHVSVHDKFALKQGLSFPPADTLFHCENIHSAGPNFIRPTSGNLGAVSSKWNFPIGAWLMPLGAENIPKVNIYAPFRCQRCKAYVNPFFKLETNACFCNICSHRFIPDKIDPIIQNSNEIYTQGVIDFKVSDPIYFKKEVDTVKILLAI
jgi:hypothetical protein